jgi:hypothetical protein
MADRNHPGITGMPARKSNFTAIYELLTEASSSHHFMGLYGLLQSLLYLLFWYENK